jgi:hypothetical protein
MLEESLLLPQKSIQVRQTKVTYPAPKGDDVGRRDNVDWVPLDKSKVAHYGQNMLARRPPRKLSGKMLLRYSQTSHGLHRGRDILFAQLAPLNVEIELCMQDIL